MKKKPLKNQSNRSRVAAFKREVLAVGKKYGLSISHEDGHGSFQIEERTAWHEGWFQRAKYQQPPAPQPRRRPFKHDHLDKKPTDGNDTYFVWKERSPKEVTVTEIPFITPIIEPTRIVVVALCCIDNGMLMVVRKKGQRVFILPGGKPQSGETLVETLHREVREELSCELGDIQGAGMVEDVGADPNTLVRVWLYIGPVEGTVIPANEIEEVRWIPLGGPQELPLAPSITNKILPRLRIGPVEPLTRVEQ